MQILSEFIAVVAAWKVIAYNSFSRHIESVVDKLNLVRSSSKGNILIDHWQRPLSKKNHWCAAKEKIFTLVSFFSLKLGSSKEQVTLSLNSHVGAFEKIDHCSSPH